MNHCQAQVRSPKVQSPKVKTKGTWADNKIPSATFPNPIFLLEIGPIPFLGLDLIDPRSSSWFKDNISLRISMAAVGQARITSSPLEDDLAI